MRQRRNRSATSAVLDSEPLILEAPELPKSYGYEEAGRVRKRRFLPFTLAWWEAVWQSPISVEWHSANVGGLMRLASLEDRYWRGDVGVASECRLLEKEFGLTTMALRSLDIVIPREAPRRPATDDRPDPTPGGDPRTNLRIVS